MNRESTWAMLSPCCTPVPYLISLSSFPTCRWMVQPLYIFRIVFIRSFGTLNLSSVAYNISWLTESKAFTRLMKKAYVSHPWCLQSVRIEWTVCRASWHPTWLNWFGYPCCLSILRRQLADLCWSKWIGGQWGRMLSASSEFWRDIECCCNLEFVLGASIV